MSLWFNILGILTSLSVLMIFYAKWSFQYWKRRNITYLEPRVPFGNIDNPFRHTVNAGGILVKKLYDRMKHTGAKYFGIYIFVHPILVIADLDMIKNILTRDFNYFTNRGVYYNEEVDPISANLVTLEGSRWKDVRAKLSPGFTASRLKAVFDNMVKIGDQMAKTMEEKYENNNPILMADILGLFTTDVMGSCAFGVDCNSFTDENSPFTQYRKKMFQPNTLTVLKKTIAFNFPKLGKALRITIIPSDVTKFFSQVVQDTMEYREKTNDIRNDFLQLLIDLKNHTNQGKFLSRSDISANSFVLFVAALGTSATSMTFTLYELARNQEIQDKVRREIRATLAKYDGKITYDALGDMKYLAQVIDESLRLYPSSPGILRKCTENYLIPGTSNVIEKNTNIFIPTYAIHHDEKYYPNPEKFDPERFSDKYRESRHPFAHIPFGDGPRNCIGLRLAWLQLKLGLVVLLNKYNFFVNPKTKEPIEFSPYSFILEAKGGIWLNVERV